MTILEDLLTFKFPLSAGKDIVIPPFRRRTFFEWCASKKVGPDRYKIHETKAGLPVVLPHYANNDIYVPEELRRNVTSDIIYLSAGSIEHLPHDFLTGLIDVKRVDGQNVISSSIHKTVCSTLNNSKYLTIFASYNILESGKIDRVQFGYHTKHEDCAFREASFTVKRNNHDSAVPSAKFMVKRCYDFFESGHKEIKQNNQFRFEQSLFGNNSTLSYPETIRNLLDQLFFSKNAYINFDYISHLGYVSFLGPSAQQKSV